MPSLASGQLEFPFLPGQHGAERAHRLSPGEQRQKGMSCSLSSRWAVTVPFELHGAVSRPGPAGAARRAGFWDGSMRAHYGVYVKEPRRERQLATVLRPQGVFGYLRQIAEVDPHITSGSAGEVFAPNLVVFIRDTGIIMVGV